MRDRRKSIRYEFELTLADKFGPLSGTFIVSTPGTRAEAWDMARREANARLKPYMKFVRLILKGVCR